MADADIDYEYPGRLVFNRLYKIKSYNNKDPENILSDIKPISKYNGGTPKKPKSNLVDIKFGEKLRSIGDLSERFTGISDHAYGYRYVGEKWNKTYGVDKEGDEDSVYIPNHNLAEVFLDTEHDTLVINASESLLESKGATIIGEVSSDIELNAVNFDFDFFLWLLWKVEENKKP